MPAEKRADVAEGGTIIIGEKIELLGEAIANRLNLRRNLRHFLDKHPDFPHQVRQNRRCREHRRDHKNRHDNRDGEPSFRYPDLNGGNKRL